MKRHSVRTWRLQIIAANQLFVFTQGQYFEIVGRVADVTLRDRMSLRLSSNLPTINLGKKTHTFKLHLLRRIFCFIVILFSDVEIP